jgi:hypothetical protein
MSELARRADEIRGISQSCKTINDLAKRTGFSMEIARHWNAELKLNLPDATPRGGAVRIAQANPKPQKKGAGK